AFCDEALCRTVALLRVPVISSVGHHTDRTLIDDVAAVCCSTPTHAAEAAVPVDCAAARADLRNIARRLSAHGTRAILARARTLAHLSRAPKTVLDRHRRHLHQLIRELRASARRAPQRGHERATAQLRLLAAHDPERTLARGYALVEDRAGSPLGTAAGARAAHDVRLRFHDGTAEAEVKQ
ncbi:MAG: hypothetical protein JOZ73_08365, partial [Solirubrobacterales bacterium]|nr:hypothetical protein [Solirubrobacterales bacterium]